MIMSIIIFKNIILIYSQGTYIRLNNGKTLQLFKEGLKLEKIFLYSCPALPSDLCATTPLSRCAAAPLHHCAISSIFISLFSFKIIRLWKLHSLIPAFSVMA